MIFWSQHHPRNSLGVSPFVGLVSKLPINAIAAWAWSRLAIILWLKFVAPVVFAQPKKCPAAEAVRTTWGELGSTSHDMGVAKMWQKNLSRGEMLHPMWCLLPILELLTHLTLLICTTCGMRHQNRPSSSFHSFRINNWSARTLTPSGSRGRCRWVVADGPDGLCGCRLRLCVAFWALSGVGALSAAVFTKICMPPKPAGAATDAATSNSSRRQCGFDNWNWIHWSFRFDPIDCELFSFKSLDLEKTSQLTEIQHGNQFNQWVSGASWAIFPAVSELLHTRLALAKVRSAPAWKLQRHPSDCDQKKMATWQQYNVLSQERRTWSSSPSRSSKRRSPKSAARSTAISSALTCHTPECWENTRKNMRLSTVTRHEHSVVYEKPCDDFFVYDKKNMRKKNIISMSLLVHQFLQLIGLQPVLDFREPLFVEVHIFGIRVKWPETQENLSDLLPVFHGKPVMSNIFFLGCHWRHTFLPTLLQGLLHSVFLGSAEVVVKGWHSVYMDLHSLVWSGSSLCQALLIVVPQYEIQRCHQLIPRALTVNHSDLSCKNTGSGQLDAASKCHATGKNRSHAPVIETMQKHRQWATGCGIHMPEHWEKPINVHQWLKPCKNTGSGQLDAASTCPNTGKNWSNMPSDWNLALWSWLKLTRLGGTGRGFSCRWVVQSSCFTRCLLRNWKLSWQEVVLVQVLAAPAEATSLSRA